MHDLQDPYLNFSYLYPQVSCPMLDRHLAPIGPQRGRVPMQVQAGRPYNDIGVGGAGPDRMKI